MPPAIQSTLARFALLATMLIAAVPAAAQDLDRGALEQLFREPVTTSATGKPQRASDVPVNMEIITQDDIRRSGATSIPGVLQYVAGVDVRRYGVDSFEVGIRGYNQPWNPRLLVLVNGRQVYLDDYGHVNWSVIPVQLPEIRQIEVIKGPNSALYGFNAVSGVINIITYDPLHEAVNTVTVLGGTQDYLGGSAVGTAQIGSKAGLRISVGGFRANDYAPRGLSPLDAGLREPPRGGAFNIDARAQPLPGIITFLEASMADSQLAEKEVTGTFDTSFTRTNSVRAGVSADTGIGLLSLSAYRNQELLSLFSPVYTGFANWLNETVYVVQASDLVKLGSDHTVRVGFEYRNNAVTAPGFMQGTISYDDFAVSAMWDWQITPRLSLTNAVRVDSLHLHFNGTPAAGAGLSLDDFNRASVTAPSFNSGLVFNATELDTFRLMLARGVQLPSLIDFGLNIPFGTAVVVSGNPHLRPSTADNLELDYDRSLPGIDSALRVAVFAQRNRDLITQPLGAAVTFGPTGIPLLISSNIGSSTAAGAEIGIKGHSASGFRWNFSYAFVATTDDTMLNGGIQVLNTIDYARSVPRHVVNAGIGYTWDRLELDLMGRWQSSYRDFALTPTSMGLDPIEVRNYVALNARIGYRLTEHLSGSLTAQQFNASRLLQTAGPPVERRLIARLTVQF